MLFSKIRTKKFVLFFHRSIGPSHDSRIRKMMSSLSFYGVPSEGMLWTRENNFSKYYYQHDASVFTLPLLLSSKASIRGSALINALEIMQETIVGFVYILYRRPRYVVVQNHRLAALLFLTVLLYRSFFKARVVWDLRELPNGFLQGSFRISIANYLFKKCSAVLVANQSRLDYMYKIYNHKCLKKAYVISNLENDSFANLKIQTLPPKLESFLSGRRYIYLQNPNSLDKGIMQSVSIISKYQDFCLVVSGNIPDSILRHVNATFGSDFIETHVFFTGLVSDLSLVSLIDHAYVSVILYKYMDKKNEYVRSNHRYAEPNRLYQSLSRGVPVLVGCNEGLSDPVFASETGVVVSDDGSIKEVIKGFEDLMSDYQSIKESCMLNKGFFSWESQEEVLIRAICGFSDCTVNDKSSRFGS